MEGRLLGGGGQVEGRLGGGGGQVEGRLVEGELVLARSRDEAGRWQEEISHGFERLVALASRVDMRSAISSSLQMAPPCNGLLFELRYF